MSYFERLYCGRSADIAKALPEAYPELPYALLAKLLRKKDVFVNGKRTATGMIFPGDSLDLFCAPGMISLQVLYRSQEVLAVYKPKGVASDGEYSFASLVRYVYPEARLMHRLDTNTDGILLFARTEQAYAVLFEAMRTHEIIKFYRARVHGKWALGSYTLRGHLFKDSKLGKVKIYDTPVKGSVKVSCDVTVVGTEGNTSHVVVRLSGGKTHQLRAQLAHSGHFILGDGKYGDDRINKAMGFSKQLLTAYAIEFAFEKDVLGLNGVKILLP